MMTRILVLLSGTALALASVFGVGCGSGDGSPSGQTTDPLSSSSKTPDPSTGPVAVDPICPVGEKLCTLGEPGSTAAEGEICVKKCVPDTWLCVAPPRCEAKCPKGETLCREASSAGKCIDKCVPEGVLCVKPPPVCDPSATGASPSPTPVSGGKPDPSTGGAPDDQPPAS